MLSPQIFLCFTISFAVVSAQSEGTCVGRCGQGYIRADPCHCDYNCMSYMECCPDYKTVCTTEGSCQGRCHEGFIRGQTCDCDPSCVGLGRCCPDYEKHCVKPVPKKPPPTPPQRLDPDPRDDPPKPTRKPEERVPENELEDPNNRSSFRSSAKNKKNPQGKSSKLPKKKKKTVVESEEEIKESEDNLSSSSFSSSSSSSSVKGSKKTKKLSRKNPTKKKPQDGDDTPDPDNPEANKNPKDKDDDPKKPPKIREGDDDPDNPETPPKEPTLDDKDKKPKKPNGKDGDEPEDPDPRPKDPNQKSPDDKDGKPSPKPKDRGDGPGDPGKTPGERLPTSPGDDDDKNPKTKKSKVIEKTEEEEDDENNEESKSSSSLKNTKKRSPTKPNKKPKKPTNPRKKTDDPSREPVLPDKGKRSPNANKPNKKKKVNPEDDTDDEPLKPGKDKNPKKKPSPKDIVKKKKKVGSEEERQETVESEFSSSSQSSSSHSRSKSTRRMTGKNKKNIKGKNKKKFPEEEPEEPLMPPKRKKYPPSTPAYTTPDEGSGDDGSGMDFLQTTIMSTTIRLNTTTHMPITVGTKKTEETLKPTVNPQTESINGSSYKTTTNIPTSVSTEKQSAESSATTVLYTARSTQEEKTTGLASTTSTAPQQMNTLNTPQDQSTADSNVKHTTPGLEKTADKSTPMGPTKHIPRSTESGLTTISSHSSLGKDSKTSPNTQTMDDSTNIMNEYSTTPAPLSTLDPNESQSQTKDTEITSIPKHKTSPNHKDSFTTIPVDEDDIENSKSTTPYTIHPHHICNLLKDEAIGLKIPGSDLKRITEICAEMQQQYPNVNIPSLQTRQPNLDSKIPPGYPLPERTPSIWYQQPGSKIIQIIEEINKRMYTSPITNLTGIPSQNTHKSTAWLLLINKIRLANDPQMNLCIGPPADGMTTLQNGSLVVFRGQYFWTLNQGGATGMPRKISEVWGIPSPIDTVFTRCNCGGKTFFFKGPRYWRFTNDVMDTGYPKEIIKGFGGLSGKVTSVLSVAGFKTKPETVYFFKPGGNVQKYTFRQEQSRRCTKKKQPSVNYPIYSQKVQTVKFRFPRAIVQHRIHIRRTFANIPQPLGILHDERSVRSTWRGIPSNIVSAVSLPNPQKKDGFDYFVFSKEKYYNINMSSKVAMKPPAQAEQKTTKDWYKCKE